MEGHSINDYQARQRKRRHKIRIAIMMVIVLIACACGGAWWTVGDGRLLTMQLFKPAARHATQSAITSSSDFAYQSASAFLQMESAQNNQGNVNYSPVSMWMALAVAAQGADGATLSQLNKTLGATSLGNKDYQSLLSSINGRYSGAKSQMSTATSLWVDNQYTLNQDFKVGIKDAFDADAQSLPFNDAAAQRMSQWINQHTQGSLKPRITLQSTEVLSIINTVVADGRWQDPFKPELTNEQTFHGTKSDSTVPMMNQTFEGMVWAHDSNSTWQRISIPFDNGGALTVLLPAAGSFDDIIQNTEKLHWALSTCLGSSYQYGCMTDAPEGWGVAAEPALVNVALPRFTITSTFSSDDSIEALKKLGVTDAFAAGIADFSKMTDAAPAEELFIGSIIQGTRIAVNEHGAKASAFTKAGASSAGAPSQQQIVEFTVDRPFLYMLTTPDDVPLFIGAVRNL
ncbi:serpin family protein [Bifidobacterium felsineum]|uniref:serpin family protein n=1 Tax=Bifidobacterium felsineum TaxID=2045440 RepID=UPI001BDBD0B7|nr:serpin family protein [Bifidobacterium felsineum]MBT1164495.1 serpin family protein [Bifidobacterium felsineum]